MLTKEPTDSLISGNVEYSDEMKNSLMVEGGVIKIKETIGQLKDDFVLLLNDVESTLNYKLMGKYMENINMNKQSVKVISGNN